MSDCNVLRTGPGTWSDCRFSLLLVVLRPDPHGYTDNSDQWAEKSRGKLEEEGKEHRKLQLELRKQGWVGGQVVMGGHGQRGLVTKRHVLEQNSSQKRKPQGANQPGPGPRCGHAQS